MLLGQSRVFYSMSRDGLVPKVFSDLHPTYKTPYKSNMLFFVFTAIFGGFIPGDIVGEMTSIGTLFAFVLVCVGVLVLRDVMPTGDGRADLVRTLRCSEGSVRVRHEWVVRFGYGKIRPWVTRRRHDGEGQVAFRLHPTGYAERPAPVSPAPGAGIGTTVSERIPCAPRISTPSMSAVVRAP